MSGMTQRDVSPVEEPMWIMRKTPQSMGWVDVDREATA